MSQVITRNIIFLSVISAICVRFIVLADFIRLSHLDQLARKFAVPIVILSLCYLIWLRYRFVRQYSKLPGYPASFGISGILPILMGNRRGNALGIAVQEMIAGSNLINYSGAGDAGVLAFFIGPMPVVLLTTPSSIRCAMMSEYSQRKGQHYDIIRQSIGDGLITSWANRWATHRKLLTPAFHLKILESVCSVAVPQSQILASVIEREASKQPDRSVANITPFIFSCTLDVLCQSSMGIDLGSQLDPGSGINRYLRRMFQQFGVISCTPWMWILPLLKMSTFGREFFGLVNQTLEFADNVIAGRMKVLKKKMTGDSSADGDADQFVGKVKEPFMDIMIHEHIRGDKNFSLRDIRDETTTFLIAGHDTTGWALSYTLLLVGHHPHVQERLHKELDEFFSENTEDDLTPENVKQFVYLDAVLRESMRLYSPVPLVARRAEENFDINGFTIPKGAQLILGISVVHRDPKIWPDPHRFKPERFLTDSYDPYAYIPFSAGPRNCIGQRYAMIQSKLELITIFRKFRIESITREDEIATYFAPVAQTETPIRLKFHKRDVNNNV